MDVKRIMKQKGITFETLAAKMGQTKGTLSASIGLNGNPTLKKLETIAQHLDCSVANAINGFVEYGGTVYRIRSVEDLKNLLEVVQTNE